MTAMIATETVRRPEASFRDPSGFVFELGGRIFRAVDASCLEVIRGLADQGLLAELIDAGRVVPTRIVEPGADLEALREAAPGAAGYLEHQRIDPISYPAEWSPAMLADAGIATLELQERLLRHGWSLKDATAYNIQFVRGRPVFIDLASIERIARPDVWPALGQFNRMFTLPLLLQRLRGADLRGIFLSHLDGLDPEEARGAFSPLGLMRPGLLADLTLPWLLGRLARRDPATTSTSRPACAAGPAVQLANLRRLRRKLRALADGSRRSTWSDYADTCSYSDRAEESKMLSIRDFLDQHRPPSVLDVGCNTGRYALLAADSGARVVAIDRDAASVDLLYRRVRAAGADVLPLCVDLANPTPAIGFRNRERPAFLERVRADCVLALAVIHHLHVSANLPLDRIRDLLADLAGRHMVLEFVPTDDGMFRRLTRFRADLYGDFTLQRCIASFSRRFELLLRRPVADSPRTLLFWKKRSSA